MSSCGPCTFSERIIVGPEIRWYISLPSLEEGDDVEPDWLWHHFQILALVWLCVLLLWVWLWGRDGTSPPTLPPVKSFKKRSKDLPPFAGLLHKGPAGACKQKPDVLNNSL